MVQDQVEARRASRLVWAALGLALTLGLALALGQSGHALASGSEPQARGAESGAGAHAQVRARSSARRLSPRVKRQLRKAHRLMRRGKMKRARRVGRRIRKRKVPQRRRNRKICDGWDKSCHTGRAAVTAARRCGLARGSALYEIKVLGFDTFKPSISQSFCWRKGRVRSVGGVGVSSNITTFGSIIQFQSEGVVYSNSYWGRWRGRKHGKRVTVRTVKITGCTRAPLIGGCLFPKHYYVRLKLVMRGNGTFRFSS